MKENLGWGQRKVNETIILEFIITITILHLNHIFVLYFIRKIIFSRAYYKPGDVSIEAKAVLPLF